VDKTLADYIHRVVEEMKKSEKNTEPLNENRYPVFPENSGEYDLPNNPYSEV
jgi:hypothetical protein